MPSEFAQLQLIKANCVDLYSEPELLERLKNGVPLRVKLGVDPSRPDLHLGHAVVLRKLATFQNLGHQVVLVIGDFTARIGDPSGRSQTRPMLSAEEVGLYAKSYEEQVFRVLDPVKTEIRFNGEWLDKLNFEKVIRLAAKYTIARMLERDDFAKRYASHEPISVSEFLYPLAQAYDSVAIKADVELGGTDQLFNLLVGRKIQEEYGQPPQIVMTMPLIEGTDGQMKMSKSYGNYIAFNDTPEDVYGKVMSIPDTLLLKYLRLLTDIDAETLTLYERNIREGRVNPRDYKMELARRMVELLYDPEEAERAQEEFVRVFQKRDLPSEIPELLLDGASIETVDLLTKAGVSSRSEAKRLVQQGGVTLDDRKLEDPFAVLSLSESMILKIGKRKYYRIVFDR
ncbi:MAG TPA: tyrosine--tRNA ligase [Thermotogota bacterium]|jgi:tyrosyl-tRNA synthetase|nr:MAG: Tyrosine--tRNA ligase [Thermotogota bacterium ADurb.Bin062]HNW47792.1 tyrosine--tRNA ligase [Thermotogota bacterium]HNY82413.1 tyrosine--tRNA ligase [Thermotogota bacterium]HOD92102.1 tyrosine--tRNA ligase [Thermotogota bacterium]HOF23412.1 tyrosine--tRNA ligase [Thermotogota bacterium]